MTKLIKHITACCLIVGLYAPFTANDSYAGGTCCAVCAYSAVGLTLTDNTGCVTTTYDFTQKSAMNTDAVVTADGVKECTIDFPAGTNALTATTAGSTCDGTAIVAFTTQTATQLVFLVPSTILDNTTFNIVIANVTNGDGLGANCTVTMDNDAGCINQETTYAFTTTACPGCAFGNDICTDAYSMTLDGTCCSATIVGMADDWTSPTTPGCQTLDGHPDAWFTATPTLSTLSITVDNLPVGGSSTFWTEAFENSCGSGCFANGWAGPNGTWTVASTGANFDIGFHNEWYISCAENGNAAGACGTGCGSDESLHLGSQTLGDIGAAYDAGGLCGILWCITTNLRAESPTINCTGYSGITLNFNYIENGQGSTDNATVWYYDGSTWTQIDDPPKVTLCGGQGTWTSRSIALPASADNNPNVKIGFNWTNNDDGVGTDPSFAVDDVTLTGVTPSPDAELIVVSSSNDLCTGTFTVENSNCATAPFTLNTTVTPGTPYWWTVSFSDGSTGTFDICADESCSEPSTAPTLGAFSGVGQTSFTINWSVGGPNYLVVVRSGSAPTAPTDGTTYTASTTFGSGSDIGGTGSFVVFDGIGTSVTVTALTCATTYFVAVFSHDCSPENYKTDVSGDGSQATSACVGGTCFDNILNNGETSVDCGGANCPACQPGCD